MTDGPIVTDWQTGEPIDAGCAKHSDHWLARAVRSNRHIAGYPPQECQNRPGCPEEDPMSAQNPAESAPSIDGSPVPASVGPATIPGPYAANLGDGANGQLSESERADLVDTLSPLIRCGDRYCDSFDRGNRGCGDCRALVGVVVAIVREHTERAWDEALTEVEQRIGSLRPDAALASPLSFRVAQREALAIIRAARQEQDRG